MAEPQYRTSITQPDSGSSASKADTRPNDKDFDQCSSFKGARPGYVFTKGVKGLGYYKDVPFASLQRPDKQAAASKPLVIKSNKSIVKVPVVTSEAKRRKLDKADEDKPHYLKEMERYRAQSCGSDTKHERPLVK